MKRCREALNTLYIHTSYSGQRNGLEYVALTVSRFRRCSQRLVSEKAQHRIDFLRQLYHLICRDVEAAQYR